MLPVVIASILYCYIFVNSVICGQVRCITVGMDIWYVFIASPSASFIKVTGYRSPTRGRVSLILHMQAGTMFGVSFFTHGRPPTVNS